MIGVGFQKFSCMSKAESREYVSDPERTVPEGVSPKLRAIGISLEQGHSSEDDYSRGVQTHLEIRAWA